MGMYETNLRLPHLRMEAVRMVRGGYGVREAARHFGYTPSAVSKWVARANGLSSNVRVIPTRSSRALPPPCVRIAERFPSISGGTMRNGPTWRCRCNR
ncbi:hypothetical protein COU12_01565 [Candidatus Jorgensenbacteria bacterium CG10_big_fil_rev_8_21_14_0_10_54_38]|uniref:Insertion element IS150 protein InsJ-like helix-turn-helix domain-containing protein n=2 Tax=Candidatus Joergenseniibacteriota TaxID=1752739 RepID=A0A2M6WG80_9BACT|nr:MAG: hypothetical protein COX26_00890 [Candidatus Jorgensenbacteria bacterium CG23_combo_of_CG06-09_8_20_14_all_54_14]PIT91724.1 MAG: hypothetical protein COU12_01565 [Candidatus Jorgensenbacteria bacterium CG10_big_fil_rev_8_21_14_0_10_54_38]